jgi:hypothetical protein
MRAEPDISVLGSNEFWHRLTGIDDFPARLLKTSMTLAPLVKARAADEVARIRDEAVHLYRDHDGALNLDALANPPKLTRPKQLLGEQP